MIDAKQYLMEVYQQDPCRTLPNPFWKTFSREEGLRIEIEQQDRVLRSLAVWEGDRLMAMWCENPRVIPLSSDQIDQFRFALVHSKALPLFENRPFPKQEAFFRFIHTSDPPVYGCPQGFAYRDVHPQTEASGVANFINSCYESIKMEETTVRDWLAHPVYAPFLWVWVIDEAVNEPAALGIGELDRSVPEASLEWIQVLPNYRGKGLGKALVGELLRRVSDVAGFTTVSGKIDNPTHPDKLYRKCGFSGRDVWWLLTS